MYNEMIRFALPDLPVNISPRSEPQSQNCFVPIHFHEEVELLYCKMGSMRVNFINSSATLTPGDVLFINERTPHETLTTSDKNIISLVQFDSRPFLSERAGYKNRHATAFLNERFHTYSLLRSHEPPAQDLMSYLNRLVEECNNRQNAWSEYIRGYITLTVAALGRNNLLFTPHAMCNAALLVRLEPVFSFIDTNFTSPITLEDMADAIHLNRSYLCRLFRQATGSTLTQYLNFVRIYESEMLLINTKDSITDICDKVGFSDSAYYDRVFRRLNGCAPTAYRRLKFAAL